jgi:HD-GYP domain-containing protein (c-di-GMP phosphodiesterase class II)
MHIDSTDRIEPAVLTIQGMLTKIDRLHLPAASRRDLESILVRQVAIELDRLLPWQAGHGQGTAAIALHIGRAASLTEEELHQLKLASLLHDIGVLMLPPCLQTKREWVEPDSYVAIQNHPRLGATLLEPFLFLREATVLIAHHHERWDGSGYPYGLRGMFIPLGARILAVADAFEAIHVPAVYDRPLRDRIALRILQVAAGTQFDPSVVGLLDELMREPETMYGRDRPHR